jgi:hypothetical protein
MAAVPSNAAVPNLSYRLTGRLDHGPELVPEKLPG